MTITVAPTLEPIGRLLTAEEYDALPENSLRELVDGVIHVMAPPTLWHQVVKDEMIARLKASCPNDLFVVSEPEVRLSDTSRRIPDLVVLQRAAFRRDPHRSAPADIVLAVEVVSPGGAYQRAGDFGAAEVVRAPGLSWARVPVGELTAGLR